MQKGTLNGKKAALRYPWPRYVYLFTVSETNTLVSSVPTYENTLYTVHFYEELCDPREGVEFLVRTRSDWSGEFAGHITWHLILYYLGNYSVL